LKREFGEILMAEKKTGTLIVIGGGEDKEGRKTILKEVARCVGKGRLLVSPVASHEPEGYFPPYEEAFKELGIEDVRELDIRTREDASDPDKLALFEGATGLLFTGGDQLRITSQLGSTPFWERLKTLYDNGGVIAGTSAGASAMCETMLVQGTGRESHRIGDISLAPGLGLIKDAIIDQHFAERGRMGRLLGTLAPNPRVLGIGIDEDTAIVVEDDRQFRVIGNGAVYIVDATSISHSNVAEERRGRALSIFGVQLHVLSQGDEFDMENRRPSPGKA
jgi:cyanophycinase